MKYRDFFTSTIYMISFLDIRFVFNIVLGTITFLITLLAGSFEGIDIATD